MYRLLYPLLLAYWFVRRPQNYGAAVILRDKDAVLLVRHTYGHRHLWYLPGGGRKRGEKPRHTAQRELFEEVGIKTSLVYIGTAQATEDCRRVTGAFFTGTMTPQQLRQDPREVEEMRWWPITALPPTLSPITRAGVSLYLMKLTRPGEDS
ncbi:MAG TPA: NUDIX domain-containing protein [Candidatus Saccharimonadales bacterium]|nr:NUDIX domain-containing protein [Candidatus Saccharimonadales bacterium]